MDKSKDKNIPNEEIFENFGYNPDAELHEVDLHDCECEDDCCCEHEQDGCECGHHHHGAKVHKIHGYLDKKTGKRMCVMEDDKLCSNCGACDMCDLDPTKVCDNCGKCLDMLSTDEKGYVHVPIDKIITQSDELSVEDLYAMYGLDDQDDEEK
ncbi:MAG: hypothetical protein IJ542_03515 [Clostridia bacterium]|nr:hypothetical protein [Clostridia bacterium]